jgi:hypothetical protein
MILVSGVITGSQTQRQTRSREGCRSFRSEPRQE